MGGVIVTIKVFPKSPEDIDKIWSGLERLKPEKMEKQPVAFGLTIIQFIKIIKDEEGGTDAIEEKIRSLDGVSDLEVESVTRSL